jgi:hypothetical protein
VALIAWIARFLLIVFVLRLVLRMFIPSGPRRPMAGGPRPRGPFGPRQPTPERVGGQLIRCAQCDTYVPELSAINVPHGGEMRHFCSDTCRAAYAAAHHD